MKTAFRNTESFFKHHQPARLAPSVSRFTGRQLPQHSAGFIQGVLLFGIALLAVVIAAFSFSNKSSSNSTAAEEAKTYAATIVSHGNAIKSATERFRLDRGGLFSQADGTLALTNLMNFSTDQYKGLFNTNDRFITPLTVQPKAYWNNATPNQNPPLAHMAGSFFLRVYTGDLPSIIKIGGKDVRHLLTTTGLTEATCRRINVNLHGPTFSAGAIPKLSTGTIGALAPTAGNFETSTDGIIITGKGEAGALHFPGVTDLEEGCVQESSGPWYVYFKVLNSQGN